MRGERALYIEVYFEETVSLPSEFIAHCSSRRQELLLLDEVGKHHKQDAGRPRHFHTLHLSVDKTTTADTRQHSTPNAAAAAETQQQRQLQHERHLMSMAPAGPRDMERECVLRSCLRIRLVFYLVDCQQLSVGFQTQHVL